MSETPCNNLRAVDRTRPTVKAKAKTGSTPTRRSTIPDQILQQLDDVVAVWEENPDFRMGPEVTLEKLRATRVQLDTCIMDVQATNRTLTRQIDDRDDCANIGNQVRGADTQGHPGLLRSQFHAIRPGRRHPPERPQDRGPAGQGHDAAPGSNKAGRPAGGGGRFRSPLLMALCRRDVSYGRGVAARRWPGFNVVFPCLRSGTNGRPTSHGCPGWAVVALASRSGAMLRHRGA
jgi:hypothetical protein